MKWSVLGKVLGLGAVAVLLLMALGSVHGLVNERQNRQLSAQQEVAASTSSAQRLAGPLLRRACTEEWTVVDVSEDAKGRRKETRRRESRHELLTSTPDQLSLDGSLDPHVLERGLFKVNTYQATLDMRAHWRNLQALRLETDKLEGKVRCGPIEAVWTVSDARGLRQVRLQAGEEALAALPGTGGQAAGFRAILADQWLDKEGALELRLGLELLGTESFYFVPAAAQVQARLRSRWPHPSFQGRFLPNERTVSGRGFDASWRVTELASNAAAAARSGEEHPDSLGLALLDPVNPYSLSDRALKYAFLFVGLTLGAVGLAELLIRRRVHPVQYGFVGMALVLFFLLLLALSEQLDFGLSYLLAATASVGLLAAYGANLFGQWRGGLGFGAGLATLYLVLYVVLNLEQAALLVGAALLFTLLALAMRLTRRVDWYALNPKAEGLQAE